MDVLEARVACLRLVIGTDWSTGIVSLEEAARTAVKAAGILAAFVTDGSVPAQESLPRSQG